MAHHTLREPSSAPAVPAPPIPACIERACNAQEGRILLHLAQQLVAVFASGQARTSAARPVSLPGRF